MQCPQEITAEVLEFATSIVRSGEPFYIPCTPLAGRPACECFPIVDEHIESHGGTRELGWSIYLWPGVFIEAELHAVWIDPAGIRHDIAPHPIPMERILFLPDPAASYGTTYQVDNHRKPLVKNPDVLKYIEAAKAIFAEENRGKFAHLDRFLTTPKWRRLQQVKADCERRIVKKFGPPPGLPAFGPPGMLDPRKFLS